MVGVVHRSFFESLESLGKADRARAREAIDKLQTQPEANGLRWHTVSNGFVSLSPTMDLRIIAQRDGARIMLLYVAHHDDAYAWASRHRLVADPISGALELFHVVDRTAPDQGDVSSNPIEGYGVKLSHRLIESGIPQAIAQEFVVCNDDNDMLVRLQPMSPEWQDVILRVACGESVSLDEVPHGSSLVRPLSKDEWLSRSLELPINAWRCSLHPSQRAAVDDSSSRLVAITGGPGTGKTVVIAHRAAEIGRRLGGDDVVVVFGLALGLVSYLKDMLRELWPDEPAAVRRVWVMPCDNVIDRPANAHLLSSPSNSISVGIDGCHCYLESYGRRRRVAAILVDESHDCPSWFLTFLRRVISETSCAYVTLALDPNQSIFGFNNRLPLQDLVTDAKLYQLPYSFRMTRQLVDHAFSVLTRYAPEYTDYLDLEDGLRLPVAILTGPKVRYVQASGTDALVARTEEALRDMSTRYPDESSLAVIHLQYASGHFRRRGRVDPVQEALKASAVISRHYRFAFWTKGLEYYAGVVVCPDNFLTRDLGRDQLLRLNTMFVALTRFRDELTIVYDPACPAVKYLNAH